MPAPQTSAPKTLIRRGCGCFMTRLPCHPYSTHEKNDRKVEV